MPFNSTYTTGLGYTPLFRIDRNSTDITSNFEDRVTSVRIDSRSGNADGDLCHITLDDRDFVIASPVTDGPDATTLDIYLGYKETGLFEQGSFQINEVNYQGMPRTMTLSGISSGFNNAAKAAQIRSYEGKTLNDIVNEIAAYAGVSASVDADLGSQAIPYLHQHSSALHLLQELERRYNGLAKFSDGSLSFTKRDSGNNASGASIGTFTLQPEDLANWSIKETGRNAYSKVRASYWDKTQHQLVWLQNQTASTSLNQIPHMIKRAFNSKFEAQSAADAMMSASNRSVRNGQLALAKGDPSIKGGMNCTVSGMREGVNGQYQIMTATHMFTRDQGIMTSLEVVSISNESTAEGDQPDNSV